MEEQTQDTSIQTANPNNADNAFAQFGAAIDESSPKRNLPVKAAFFTETEEKATEAPQASTAPETQETPTQDAKNDERRFQYWQSQAAKRENELQALQQEVQGLKNKPAAPQEAETVQEFPPPPPPPKKPAGFSREEAWSDSKSASAQYLDDKDRWDSDISEYGQLKHQYDLAVMQEKLDKQTNYLATQEKQRQNKIEQGKQLNNIAEHVQGHYGLNPQETNDFIRTMSDPKSLSMDNLVQLFRMNQAGGQPAQTSGPSEAFQQAKNAQQIPSPMGVMPSQATDDNRNDADKIMDSLIQTHNSKNPWT